MAEGLAIARRRVQIVNTYGLHMRPSTKFVKLANSFKSGVVVDFQGTRANGKSILEMTSLAAECGTQLDLEAQGVFRLRGGRRGPGRAGRGRLSHG